MKKMILISLLLVLGLTGCTNTADEDVNPCETDSTSDACLALYDERTVFEYTDMSISRDTIYDFEVDEQGWQSYNAVYSSSKGSFELKGTGDSEERTSYMYNRIAVPKEITYGLVVKYQTSTNGSEVRIVAFDRFNQEVVLKDWTEVQSDSILVDEFDLVDYSGQTLALYIEQRSNQETENYIEVTDIRFGISGNISTKTNWTFDTDLEDWGAENNGKAYDHSEWRDGYVYLDGSDFGLPEDPVERNGWVYNMFQIPENGTTTFSFDVWANEGDSDAAFRIRVFDESVQEYVLNDTGDWEVFVSPDAYRYTVDLTPFAGQRIAIFLESDDDGEGCGEAIFIDNIILETK